MHQRWGLSEKQEVNSTGRSKEKDFKIISSPYKRSGLLSGTKLKPSKLVEFTEEVM